MIYALTNTGWLSSGGPAMQAATSTTRRWRQRTRIVPIPVCISGPLLIVAICLSLPRIVYLIGLLRRKNTLFFVTKTI